MTACAGACRIQYGFESREKPIRSSGGLKQPEDAEDKEEDDVYDKDREL